jgi:transcriptional regulator with XRE-family HTH domain
MPEKQAKVQGERLKKIRLRLALSQVELAVVMESTQSHVSSIEAGRSSINVTHLAKLLLHNPSLNINWYLTGDGDMFLPGRAAGAAGMAAEPSVGYGSSVEDRLAAVEAFIAWKFADFPGSKKYS